MAQAYAAARQAPARLRPPLFAQEVHPASTVRLPGAPGAQGTPEAGLPRRVCQLLSDCSGLRDAIGLTRVPHFTTLQKASRRLLKLTPFRALLDRSVRRILKRRRRTVKHAAGDSTGFDAHHASRHYVHRRDTNKSDPDRPKKRVTYQRYGKLLIIVCCLSHAILSAVASAGPGPDIDQLGGAVAAMVPSVRLWRIALDAGFDSGPNHRMLLREGYGITSFIPPLHGRPPKDPHAQPRPTTTGG
jgi:hypothetical protein